MERYELWLDESGSFEDDGALVRTNSKMNPSLIGGILFKEGDFSEEQAQELIKEAAHACEEGRDVVYERFRRIVETNVMLVEISNEECIHVIDSNLTYQNIMAEGLIQIITKLKLQHADLQFKIDILIAERGDCTSKNKNDKKVSVEQYTDRIKERMVLEGYKKGIPQNCWSIQTADAQKDKRLMMADTVCNSFLTWNTKFKGKRGEHINSIREDETKTLWFSVFETSLDNTINRLLLDGRLGEAVVCLCQSKNDNFIKKRAAELCRRMENMQYGDIRRQMKIVSLRISYFVENTMDYKNCIILIDNLLKYWVDGIGQMGKGWAAEIAELVQLDLLFYKYTIFTHQGNVDGAEKCGEICDSIIRFGGKMNFEKLEYVLKYTNRKIIQKINLFDFKGALQDSDGLVQRCEGIKEAIGLSESDIMFEELGKALGTRAQIHMFLIREDASHFELAKKDAERAKEEFDKVSDKQRQDLYLSQIYSEASQFDEACKTLCGSTDTKELGKWLADLKGEPFKVCAYVRIMAEGKSKDWEYADKLYDAFDGARIKEDLEKNGNKSHPRECIFWKLGTYYANVGNRDAGEDALTCYKEALECCKQGAQTLRVLGFAIELERYAYALRYHHPESKEFLQMLRGHYNSYFLGNNMPETMREIFRDLDLGKRDWKYFYDYSRKVTY